MNEILSNLARTLALAAGFAISLWVAPPWRRRGLVLTVALLLPLAGCGPSKASLEAIKACVEQGGKPDIDDQFGEFRGCEWARPQPCPCVEKFRPGSWVCLEEVPR